MVEAEVGMIQDGKATATATADSGSEAAAEEEAWRAIRADCHLENGDEGREYQRDLVTGEGMEGEGEGEEEEEEVVVVEAEEGVEVGLIDA